MLEILGRIGLLLYVPRMRGLNACWLDGDEIFGVDWPNLPMKMEPIVSSETSAIKSQTPGNYPKRNKLHLQHGESLESRLNLTSCIFQHITPILYVALHRHWHT